MMKTKPCTYCGTPVTGNFYGCTVVCDSPECDKEDQECEQQMQEDAKWDAIEDGYSRYM